MNRLIWTLIAAFVAVACSSIDRGREGDDSTPSVRRDGGTRDAGGPLVDAGDEPDVGEEIGDAGPGDDGGAPRDGGSGDAGSSDGGSTTTTATYCQMGCTTAGDCASLPGGGAFDADNWSCTKGLCAYGGCRSDAECHTSYGINFVCRSINGAVPSCAQTCTKASDCTTTTGTSGAFDVDNYACINSACVHTGCKSDAECQVSLGNPGYRCYPPAAAGAYPYCYLGNCRAASDCATGQALGGAYDADNWECVEGDCNYHGCKTTQECTVSFQGSGKSYVCK